MEKRLLQILKDLSNASNTRMSETFWNLMEYYFYDTMKSCEQISKGLGFKENPNPFDAEDCDSKIEEILKRIEFNEELFREFMIKWTEGVMERGEDPINQLMGHKEMQGTLNTGKAGQFFTPPALCRLAAQMTEDHPGKEWDGITEWVIEPSAGFGSMLLADFKVLNEKYPGEAPCRSRVYVAQELYRRTAMVCWLQMNIAGMTGYVDCIDSLQRERYDDRWFTIHYISILRLEPEALMWYQTAMRHKHEPIQNKVITQNCKFKMLANPPFDTKLMTPFMVSIIDTMNDTDWGDVENAEKLMKGFERENSPIGFEEINEIALETFEEMVETIKEIPENQLLRNMRKMEKSTESDEKFEETGSLETEHAEALR